MLLNLIAHGSTALTAPTVRPSIAVSRANVKLLGGYDYSDEEVEEVLKNQPASFVIGGRGVSLDWTTDEIQDVAGMKQLANKLNPVIGYWDPLYINDIGKETIAWFRHAEIKHGRVAMAAFVGFCVQANGIHWPWNLQGGAPYDPTPVISFADISAAGGPCDQWDALPSAAKLQILFFVACFEAFGESSPNLEKDGQKHYVRGGKPGYYPKIKDKIPHPIPFEFFDPFGLQKDLTEAQKETKLIAEINNGRLAMIGIMGLVSASKGLIVPGLDSLGLPKYAGEPMAFFSSVNAELPYVSEMLASSPVN